MAATLKILLSNLIFSLYFSIVAKSSKSHSVIHFQSFFQSFHFILLKGAAANSEIENEKQAIDATNRALSLYSQLSTETVPWNKIREILEDLKTRNGFAKQDAGLVGGTVTHLMNVMDSYFSVVQHMREWCGLAKPLITVYNKKLDTAENSATQKSLLLRVLENEMNKINRAEVKLNDISSNLREAAEKMTIVRNHLKNKSDAQSVSIRGFVESAGARLHSARIAIDQTNANSKNIVNTIRNLKAQIEETNNYESTAELRSSAVQSGQKLIVDCDEYRKISNY